VQRLTTRNLPGPQVSLPFGFNFLTQDQLSPYLDCLDSNRHLQVLASPECKAPLSFTGLRKTKTYPAAAERHFGLLLQLFDMSLLISHKTFSIYITRTTGELMSILCRAHGRHIIRHLYFSSRLVLLLPTL
jgi:uncharacterized protein YbaR (Trm112 family)